VTGPSSEPLSLTVERSPAPADERVVSDGLRAFNDPFIGPPDETPLAVFVRDPTGRVVGGLLGHTKWRWCYVAKLWLPAELRGSGWGARVLAAAEAEAWARGCLGVYLDTFEYQALPFYRRQGYELVGTLDGFPPGYKQYHVRKLRPAEAPAPPG
jgi:GNAT superfamily N-acetyltransferase